MDAIDNSAGVDTPTARSTSRSSSARRSSRRDHPRRARPAAGRGHRRRGRGRAARQRPPEHGPEPGRGGQRRPDRGGGAADGRAGGAGVLDRAVEALPTTEEMAARGRAGAGLTRPELAVLLAGAKRGLTAALLASGVPDQPACGRRWWRTSRRRCRAVRPPARRAPPAPGAGRLGAHERGGRPDGRDVRLPPGGRHRPGPVGGGCRLVDGGDVVGADDWWR